MYLKVISISIFLYLANLFNLSLAENINLYSARQEVLMRPLIRAFEEKEGIRVNIISAKANQLIDKIQKEGKYTKADILLTVDIARLLHAKSIGLFMAVNSNSLEKNIPAGLRDNQNFWFCISKRARVFVYDKNRVLPSELKGYIDLMENKWKSRILVRSSNNVYNQSLIAAMINNYGKERVNKFLYNFKNNFSRNPSGGDRDQIRAVLAGEGDIALVNSYYYFKMKKNDKNNKLKNLKIYFPHDKEMKTHINISGAGIIKYTKHYNNALKFLEFLISDKAQKIYAEKNFEYPIKNNIILNDFMSKYVIPKEDGLDLNLIGNYNKEALFMMTRAGWR